MLKNVARNLSHAACISRRSLYLNKVKLIKKFSTMKNLIPDMPKGPLEVYRKRASFDWKKLKLYLDGEDFIQFKDELWGLIKNHPSFQKPKRSLTLDESRMWCNKQLLTLMESGLFPTEKNHFFNALFMYDPSIPVKLGICYGMVPNVLLSLGTEKHFHYVEKILQNKCTGCFALTEMSHGTNAKGIRTTATYEPKTESFILHTPDFEAAKCWVGLLGKTATHAILYAQLITPDNVNHGLHPFIVQVRDLKTMLPMPGVKVGDLGEKIGLNGVDNGFVVFNHYRIPRDGFLNKNSDVTPDGKYVSAFKDQSKRFGASLGTLSAGRVNITNMCAIYAGLATTIAIRYCCVRKQFGPKPGVEWPVIEYQALQARLIPHLAATFAMQTFSINFMAISKKFIEDLMTGENKEKLGAVGIEIHALSSATKPFCAWLARDIVQDCRECCGGHGYLKVARLGDIRADNDANCTYEGENNVLVQQASNWLINQWSNVINGKGILSPLNSANFLMQAESILTQRFSCTTMKDTLHPENLLDAMKWLTCYYLQKSHAHVNTLRKEGRSDFAVRNDSQTFYAKTLTLVYAEHAVTQDFLNTIGTSNWDKNEREVLMKLASLFAASCIEKRLGDFYAGGYATVESKMADLLRDGILVLCKDLVNEAASLVDVISPPDFILNSALGMSDGEVYKHLERSILDNPENLERAKWWQEILPSKL